MASIDRRSPLAAVLVTAAIAMLSCAGGAADSLRFPKPDRPIARIVSPAYSTEDKRDRHGEAERVMDRLGVRAGLRVADLGAGDGYYTVRLARRIGPGAAIYAEDVESGHLERLRARLTRDGISGITIVHGTPGDPKLPEASIDLAILSHMYHEIENPYEFLFRLRPALAPGARVAIIDLDKPTREHGTPPELLRCELAAVGYREVDVVSLAPADGYLAVFVPPESLPAPEAIRPCRQ
jgi:SAM-dependent methyltransferase